MPRIKWRRGLYAITDTVRFQNDALLIACEQALKGGVVMLQYRDKSADHLKRQHEALALRKLCHQYKAFFIVDNDVDLCQKVDADGVHLGPQDLDTLEVRKRLGPGSIIGVSCHQSLDKAHQALKETANYISFGAFYPSKTRPDAQLIDKSLLTDITKFPIPSVAIGGINLDRAENLVHQGIDHIAIISDLWNSQDIELHAKKYTELFEGYSSFLDRGIM